MAIIVVTPPAIEPITLEEARTHIRSDSADDGTEVTQFIETARVKMEAKLRRALITQTLDIFRDSFPGLLGVIEIPRPPTQSVTSITYLDTNGDSQTLSASNYVVTTNSTPARIVPADGEQWPDTQVMVDAVTIRIVAGYGDAAADVPAPIVQGMLLAITDMYDHRGTQIIGAAASAMPITVDRVISEYKTYIPEEW